MPSSPNRPVPGTGANRGRTGVRVVKAAPPSLRGPSANSEKAASTTHRSRCPVNLALEMVGDSWTMLLIRDMMLRGHKSYQGFLRSNEGIATNILADRLQKLERNGLVTRQADPSDARKIIYSLTEKGADLAPLLVELALFGARYEPRLDFPKDILSEMRRDKVRFSSKLTKSNAPPKVRAKAQKTSKSEADETLSLF